MESKIVLKNKPTETQKYTRYCKYWDPAIICITVSHVDRNLQEREQGNTIIVYEDREEVIPGYIINELILRSHNVIWEIYAPAVIINPTPKIDKPPYYILKHLQTHQTLNIPRACRVKLDLDRDLNYQHLSIIDIATDDTKFNVPINNFYEDCNNCSQRNDLLTSNFCCRAAL